MRQEHFKKYYGLQGYDLQAYRALQRLRKIATSAGLKLQKVSKQDRYIATDESGLTKTFESIEELENFIESFAEVRKELNI